MDEKRVNTTEGIEEGFTLIELWCIIKKNILWLILTIILFVLLGGLYTFYIVKPMYKSSIDVLIYFDNNPETPETVNTKVTNARQAVINIREEVKFKSVITAVLKNNQEELDVDYTWQQVAKRLSTSAIGDSTFVKIIYEDPNPIVAQKMVIEIAEELARRHNLSEEDEDYLKFHMEKIKPINSPEINPNQKPSSPNKTLNMVISLLLGAIVGVVFVILKEQFSSIFQSEKDVESTLRLPVIAMIPQMEGIVDEND